MRRLYIVTFLPAGLLIAGLRAGCCGLSGAKKGWPMIELVARGKKPTDHWHRPLPPKPVTLGRVATESNWDVAWDNQISGLHATLTWQNDGLLVQRRLKPKPTTNPILFRGQQLDEFTLKVGDSFLIGDTTFTVEENALSDSGLTFTCSPQELQQVKYVAADDRINALSALPELIRDSPSDEELARSVIDVLLRGITHAGAAAVFHPSGSGGAEILKSGAKASSGRDGGAEPSFSRRLIDDAFLSRRPIWHGWHAGEAKGKDFTQVAGVDWAICVPLLDDASTGWALCVTGSLPPEWEIQDRSRQDQLKKSDLKFVDLVAKVFGSLRMIRDLQKRQSALSCFLSQPLLNAIAGQDMETVLRPREAEVTVLFCDLRGSCQIAEATPTNELWNRVSAALEIMTGCIIDQDGVIGDFQGDAAMGFWGWPVRHDDQVERAARAALNIRKGFAKAAQQSGNPLAGFRCGIGIATGPAIAGRLGTSDQSKISVYGHIVNLAARLESMTKFFEVPILLDECTGDRLRASEDRNPISCPGRRRRLARIRPYGMSRTDLTVSELLPRAVEPGAMSASDRGDYAAALAAFLDGRWEDVQEPLDRFARHWKADGPTKFLRAFMEKHQNTPPTDWDGVIKMEGK